jgi:hypothetical protein
MRSELSKYKDEIISLARRVLDVDVRAYESMPPDRLASELQPIVSELLRQANDVLARLLETFEAEHALHVAASGEDALGSPYVPFEQAIDAAIGSQSSTSIQAVGDIAFLAHLELRQRAERLERVTACRSAIAIVGECDSALRRVRKALTSIDVVLARAGLVEPSLDFASELEVSLRVRRACAKLRRRVVSGPDPSPETLHARLRSAGTAFAMLVGWEVYPSLRVRDRLQLRDLQRRILDWLRRDQGAVEGFQLWQDLVGFVRMLAQVNRRQELVDHDMRVVRGVREHLRERREPAIDDASLARLATLEGLDDEVDALLSTGERLDSSWSSVLARVARQLGCAEGIR